MAYFQILWTWTITLLWVTFLGGTLKFSPLSSIYVFYQFLIFSVMEGKLWVNLILFFCRQPTFIAKIYTRFPFLNPRMKSVSISLVLPSLQTVRNKVLFFKPCSLWYTIMATLTDYDNMHMGYVVVVHQNV